MITKRYAAWYDALVEGAHRDEHGTDVDGDLGDLNVDRIPQVSPPIMKVINIVDLDRDVDTIAVTNGFGTRMEAGLEIPANRSLTGVEIKMDFTCLTKESFASTKDALNKSLTEDEKNHLNENYAGYAGEPVAFFCGVQFRLRRADIMS